MNNASQHAPDRPGLPPALCATKPAVLCLLGRFLLNVMGENRGAVLSYDRARLILAIIALAQGRVLDRRVLAQMVWPLEDISTARTRLRHALHMLRGAFRQLPEALVIDKGQVRLNLDLVDVDVLRITTPDAGFDDEVRLAAYRGRFLDDLNIPDSEALRTWQQEWAARVDIELEQCRVRLSERHLQTGNLHLALEHAKRWVQWWPHDELCHRHLIRLLLRLNQRDAALRAYEHCAAVLASIAGGAPSAETRALLGLEHQPLDLQSSTALLTERRTYIPLAVLAVALSWEASIDDDIEDVLASQQADRRRIVDCLVSQGAWIPQLEDTTLQAYFGYPAPFERPVRQAAALARTLSRLPLHPQSRLGLGLHADIALIESGSRPDSGGLLSQSAVALAWKAEHREIALSPASAARLDEYECFTQKRHGQRIHLLRLDARQTLRQRMHGRTNEFDNLIQLWARLTPGRPPTSIQISGPAGIGKSLLAQALADYVETTGGLVIRLECEENRRETPWRPLLRWLQEVTALELKADSACEQTAAPTSQLPGRQLLQQRLGLSAQAAQVLWNLMQAEGSLAPLNQATPALLEAAAMALTHRATALRPLLITLENLHWVDQATEKLLRHLARHEWAAPIMLLLTCRDASAPDWVSRHLHLAPLSDTALTELVAQRAKQLRVPREIRARIIGNSQGIPLYAHAMLRQAANGLQFDIAPQIIDMVCLRLSQASAEARQLVLVMTVLGRALNIRQLQTVLGLARMRTELVVQQLLKLGLLEADGDSLDCPLLVRNAMSRITTRAERQQLQAQLARHLVDCIGALSSPTAG